ncbi:permease prefix domain 1-containing protein [Streptomyces sp. XM4193]|uniref:permease prefix domain 1-containing protein n=1 Tax=Streptomyces sp. XM4193 TaxID=2929782 RepID=UPI001FF9CB72|nr:permease prefix domain 1-containing protein [Streptomyces sp. XM4193]MCK1797073.1 permease prefix domain 1-containing protein [Streptomyces sp. XM4193]
MIDAYVAELDRALRGPRAAKADLIAEARDGLLDAADAYEEDGRPRQQAERSAVEEFGTVREIASEYQTELGLAQGRRTAILICAVMILQPVVWWVLQVLGGAGTHQGSSRALEAAEAAVRWSGGIAIAVGVGVLLAAGVGVRYLGARRLVARITGFFAFTVCAVFAVLGVLMTLGNSAADSLLSLTGLPVTLLVLGVPLAGIGLSGRRCLGAA